eukprot:1461901-Rhodomonas_salina.4
MTDTTIALSLLLPAPAETSTHPKPSPVVSPSSSLAGKAFASSLATSIARNVSVGHGTALLEGEVAKVTWECRLDGLEVLDHHAEFLVEPNGLGFANSSALQLHALKHLRRRQNLQGKQGRAEGTDSGKGGRVGGRGQWREEGSWLAREIGYLLQALGRTRLASIHVKLCEGGECHPKHLQDCSVCPDHSPLPRRPIDQNALRWQLVQHFELTHRAIRVHVLAAHPVSWRFTSSNRPDQLCLPSAS